MATKQPKSLFRRLTRLFRSGPVVKRKIRALDTSIAVADKTKSSGTLLFQKSLSPTYATITSNAYNLSERLMRYQDFQEMEYTPEIAAAMDIYADETVAADEKGRCLHVYSDNEKIKEMLEDLFYNILNVEFNLRSWARNLPVHKDTVIPLLDGRNITIEQLAKEHEEGKQNWVYSVQDGTHRTVPGRVNWCGLTRRNSELVRVWLDDGTYVDCTPDHRFKLRDGTGKEAQYLVKGESLMPFYRKTSRRSEGAAMDGYEEVYDSSSGRYVYTHRRVAEILEKGTLKKGRWLVTHHRDFDKRNNDPANLVRMDEKEHMDLHRQLAIEILHSPEVTAKRLVGIDRWLRSDEHRVKAKEQLKVLQAKGLMKTSWDDYNKSPQAKHDNEKRSKLKKKMWADKTRRASTQANMAIKFDTRCVDMIVEALAAHGKYVSPKVLGNQLKTNEAFMSHFRTINNGTKRDLTKALNSHAGFEGLLNKTGISTYIDLIKQRLPIIASTPWFKRAEKKSLKMSGIVPTMREFHSSTKSIYKNHKVDRVEKLEQTSDVYCMEVLGVHGEHDRHNFMILTTSDKRLSVNSGNDSGICLENCKYGDFFLYNDVSPEYGVVNAFPIPVNEIEREENYDRDDPFAVRYRWVTLGNRTLENWEVTHFRLLGNDMFLPYGSSIIEPARRIWRQLILIEDAMLVYRVVRAPERRVFYIDVANIPPADVPTYIEQQRQNMRTSPVVDRQTGRVDLRYNPMSVEEDYFIPVRGGESGTKIDTLAGGQNTAAVEDVAYIQKKLFAALKIPRAYLGYDELLSSKATLAQEDIRFSRTINVIQKTMLAELNKLAIIHLYAHGFDGEDLQNFTLRLSNPSTVAQQQKLELWRAKFEIAGSAPEGMASKKFVRNEIWGLNQEQIEGIDDERMREKLIDTAIEQAGNPDASADGTDDSTDDLFGAPPGDEGTEEPADAGSDVPPEENAGEKPAEEIEPETSLLTGGDDYDNDESFSLKIKNLQDKPIKVQSQLDRVLYNRGRRRTHGASKTHMPDFQKMTSSDNHATSDPYDKDWLKALSSNPFGENAVPQYHKPLPLAPDVTSTLRRMTRALNIVRLDQAVITEGKDVQNEIDLGQSDILDIDLFESGSSKNNLLSESEVFTSDDIDDEEDS